MPEQDQFHENSTTTNVLWIIMWVLVAILFAFYLGLVVWLGLAMYSRSRIGLCFVVIIGSFLCPVVVPAVVLMMLSLNVLQPIVQTKLVQHS